MITAAEISSRIAPATNHMVQHYDSIQHTNNIIEVIQLADSDNMADTTNLAPLFKQGNIYDTCFEVWKAIKNNINYQEDPEGLQDIKYPAQLWHDKIGDCKSFSLFITSILKNLGIPCAYKFISESKKEPVHHVYVVAYDENNCPILIDATLKQFNYEVPYAQFMLTPAHTSATRPGVGSIKNTAMQPLNINALTPEQFEALYQKQIENKNYTVAQAMFTRYTYGNGINGIGGFKDFMNSFGNALLKLTGVDRVLKNKIEKAISESLTAGSPFFLYMFYPETVSAKAGKWLPDAAYIKFINACKLMIELAELLAKVDYGIAAWANSLQVIVILHEEKKAKNIILQGYIGWYTNPNNKLIKSLYWSTLRIGLIGQLKANPVTVLDNAFQEQINNYIFEISTIGDHLITNNATGQYEPSGTIYFPLDLKLTELEAKSIFPVGGKIFVSIRSYRDARMLKAQGEHTVVGYVRTPDNIIFGVRVNTVFGLPSLSQQTAEYNKLLTDGGGKLDLGLPNQQGVTVKNPYLVKGLACKNPTVITGYTPVKVSGISGWDDVSLMGYFANPNPIKLGVLTGMEIAAIIGAAVSAIAIIVGIIADIKSKKSTPVGAALIPNPPCDFGYPYQTTGGNWVSCGKALGTDNSTNPVLVNDKGQILEVLSPGNLPPEVKTSKSKEAGLGWIITGGLMAAAAAMYMGADDEKPTSKAKVSGSLFQLT